MTDEHGMPGKVPLSARTRPAAPVNQKTLITPEQRSAAVHEQNMQDGKTARLILLIAGALMVLLGFIILITATSIFVGVIAGAVFTSGAAWIAGGIIIGALRK